MHLFSFNRPFTSIAARAAAIAIALSAATSLVHAQIYTELGDAGSTQAGAQNTGFVQTLNGGDFTILGTFLSPTDADVYRLTINSPTTFSASTVNTLTASNGGAGGLDTQLFLFDSAGHAIVMNDDATGLVLQSTIPAHTAFMNTLAAGVYYIAISLAGNDPVNINNQLMFAMNGGNTTAIRGAASGTSPNNWNDFNGGTFFAQQGAYQINLVNVPDNGSTLLLVGIGAAGLLFASRRIAVRALSRS